MTTKQKSDDEPASKKKQLHFGWLLLLSFLLFTGAYVIDQTVRWTNHFEGFVNGAFHGFFTGLVWAVYLGTWSAVVWALYRWRGWRRFRTAWVLGPAVLVFVVQLGSLVTSPPTAEARFRYFTGVALPEEIEGLRVHFTGGGVADYGDTYYFTCGPELTDRLILDLALLEDESAAANEGLGIDPYSPVPVRAGWPDYREWDAWAQYSRADDKGWFFFLVTDAARTRVYVFMGCI